MKNSPDDGEASVASDDAAGLVSGTVTPRGSQNVIGRMWEGLWGGSDGKRVRRITSSQPQLRSAMGAPAALNHQTSTASSSEVLGATACIEARRGRR